MHFKSVTFWDGVEDGFVEGWLSGRNSTFPKEGKDPNLKHVVEFAHLFYVSVAHVKLI